MDAEQFKRKCGTHFSGGLVDVGLTTTVDGKQAYTCAKCVAKKAAVKAQEEAEKVVDFSRRWMKVEHVIGDFSDGGRHE